MESNSTHYQGPEQFTKIYESVPRKAKILPPEPDDSRFLHREHAQDIVQVVDDSASSRSSSRDGRTRYRNDRTHEQPSPVGSNSEWAEEVVAEGSTQPPAEYPVNEVVDLTIDLSAPVETQSNPKKLFKIIALNKPLTSIRSEANGTKKSVDRFAHNSSPEKPRSRFSGLDQEASTIADVLIDLTDFSESFSEVPAKTQLSGVNNRPSDIAAQKDVRADSASNRSASKRVEMMKSYDAFTDGFDKSEANANKYLKDQQPRQNNKEKPQRNDQVSPDYVPSAQRQRLNSLYSEGIPTNKRPAPLARNNSKEEIARPSSSHLSTNDTGSAPFRPRNVSSKASNFESESRRGSDSSNVNLKESTFEPREKTIPAWEKRRPSILKERPLLHPELTKKRATPFESHNTSQSSPQQIQKPPLARGSSFKHEDYFFKPTLHAYDLCWIRVFAITSEPYFGGNKLGRPIYWPCVVGRVLKEYSRLSSTPYAEQSPIDGDVIRAFRGNALWVNERDDASVNIDCEDAGHYVKVKPSVADQAVALYEIELLGLADARDILVEGQMLEPYQQLKVMGPFPKTYSFVIPSAPECLIVKYMRGLRRALGLSQSRLNVIGLQKKAAMLATQVPKMPFREATGDNLLINLKDKSWFGVICGAEMIHCGDIVRVKTESCVVTDVLTGKKGARAEDLMLDSSICGYGCGGWVLPEGEMLMEVVRVEFKEGDVQSLKLFGYLCYLDRVAIGDDGAAKFQVKRGWFLKHDNPADGTNRTDTTLTEMSLKLKLQRSLSSSSEKPIERSDSISSAATVNVNNATLSRSNTDLYNVTPTDLVVDGENNTAALGLTLDPADVLTDRTRGWAALIRVLIHHYDRLADAEKAQARSHAANAKEWALPSPVRQLAFTDTSAVNAISAVLKADATALASQHAAIQKSLEKQTITALDGIRKTLKKKLDVLEKEQRERNRERLKDKEIIVKAKETLTKAISFARRPGTDAHRYSDPWLANMEVKRKLAQAKDKHAARNQKLIDTKADFKVFEANLIRELKVALIGVSTISEIQNHRAAHAQEIEAVLGQLDAEKEWESFCINRLNKSGGPAMFETDEYEGFDDPLVGVIHEGLLSRKSKGLIKSYKEHYYVVTAAGYLHEFKKEKPHPERGETVDPDDTIYLGHCSLDPLGTQDRKPEEFILTEKNEDGKMFQRSSHVYKYIGSSIAITKQFYDAISSVSKVTLGVVATGSTNAVLGRTSTVAKAQPETPPKSDDAKSV
ncbi:hypothetical protein HDU78_001388 [Chytriomyces hyalinus]|nr:hypothetical protein HDU78_001388 [Chytriomyces hyalinus]